MQNFYWNGKQDFQISFLDNLDDIFVLNNVRKSDPLRRKLGARALQEKNKFKMKNSTCRGWKAVVQHLAKIPKEVEGSIPARLFPYFFSI